MAGALRCPVAGGSRRLADLLTRYGGAIERDLFDRGWLLSDLFGRRQFRLLLNVIDGLPSNSAFGEAVANDDEAVERHLELVGDQSAPGGPKLSEFGPSEELLAALYDRLGEVIQAVIGSQGGKPPNFHPWPRPALAVDRVRRRRAENESRDLLAKLVPHDVGRL